MPQSRIAEIIDHNASSLLASWTRSLQLASAGPRDRISESQLNENTRQFLSSLREALAHGNLSDISRPEWGALREQLNDLSRQRAGLGFSPAETARFVFSFKEPLFARLREEYGNDSEGLVSAIWVASELLDKLGLYTSEAFMKGREEMIKRQQQEMLELSTPVVELWTGILALPLIGTLDSSRTQVVMQNLLEAIVAKSADLAIIDITGVPTVDTLVAQHLLKTVAAARLMGAECIISGIRPQIAQTIIHLGVDLGGVLTKATLADAFKLGLKRKNLAVTKV